MVPAYLDAHPRWTHWILPPLTDGAVQPVVLDDALDEVSVGVWRVDDALGLLVNAHVEQGDRSASSFPSIVDPLKGDGGRMGTQQKAGLFSVEMQKPFLAVGVDGDGPTVETI